MTHQEALDTLASERYLLNEMSDHDRNAFEEHFFDCEVCADDLRVGAAMLQGARAGFAGTTATSGRVFPIAAKRPVAKPVWSRSVVLPSVTPTTRRTHDVLTALLPDLRSHYVLPYLCVKSVGASSFLALPRWG